MDLIRTSALDKHVGIRSHGLPILIIGKQKAADSPECGGVI
jgi:hypothetical protein